MEYKNMFHQELINLEMRGGTTEEEIFSLVAKELEKRGLVNAGYLKGIVDREKQFPTGLITQHLNIALPHSDPEYVERPFVYIARVKEPIAVKQMGDNQEMKVNDFFFLGIKDPKNQVGLLQSFMEAFMDESFVKKFRNTNCQTKMYELFQTTI